MIDKITISTTDGESVIMTFSGEPIMLYETVGAMKENTLTWQRNGVESYLVAHTLGSDELVAIASSVTEASDK